VRSITARPSSSGCGVGMPKSSRTARSDKASARGSESAAEHVSRAKLASSGTSRPHYSGGYETTLDSLAAGNHAADRLRCCRGEPGGRPADPTQPPTRHGFRSSGGFSTSQPGCDLPLRTGVQDAAAAVANCEVGLHRSTRHMARMTNRHPADGLFRVTAFCPRVFTGTHHGPVIHR